MARKRVKRSFGCSDTNEKSLDESVFRKKTARHQRESRNYIWTHLQLHTCHSSHVLVNGAQKKCSAVQLFYVTSGFQFFAWRRMVLKHQSPHAIQFFTLDVTSGERHQKGYAGVRLGEAQNPGPAEHGRDSAQEEPSPRRTRMFQEAKTPSREEFGIHSKARRPATHTRKCSPAATA